MEKVQYITGRYCLTDIDYINGLKTADQEITYRFFYELCGYILYDIRSTLLQGRVEFDDMVNELYVYLSDRNWHKLDTFAALNGCRLSSWMIPLSWRFFLQRRAYLLGMSVDNSMEVGKVKDDYMDEFDIEVLLEVEQTFAVMPNKKYVQVLRWLLIDGYNPDEVAVRLHTRVSNVYNIKHRAVVQFIKYYGEQRKNIRFK